MGGALTRKYRRACRFSSLHTVFNWFNWFGRAGEATRLPSCASNKLAALRAMGPSPALTWPRPGGRLHHRRRSQPQAPMSRYPRLPTDTVPTRPRRLLPFKPHARGQRQWRPHRPRALQPGRHGHAPSKGCPSGAPRPLARLPTSATRSTASATTPPTAWKASCRITLARQALDRGGQGQACRGLPAGSPRPGRRRAFRPDSLSPQTRAGSAAHAGWVHKTLFSDGERSCLVDAQSRNATMVKGARWSRARGHPGNLGSAPAFNRLEIRKA